MPPSLFKPIIPNNHGFKTLSINFKIISGNFLTVFEQNIRECHFHNIFSNIPLISYVFKIYHKNGLQCKVTINL